MQSCYYELDAASLKINYQWELNGKIIFSIQIAFRFQVHMPKFFAAAYVNFTSNPIYA